MRTAERVLPAKMLPVAELSDKMLRLMRNHRLDGVESSLEYRKYMLPNVSGDNQVHDLITYFEWRVLENMNTYIDDSRRLLLLFDYLLEFLMVYMHQQTGDLSPVSR